MVPAHDIAVVLLAAGLSRRFGAKDKLLAMLDGQPLVTHAIHAITAFGPARRIAVCASADVAALAKDAGFDVLLNGDPARGLASSLAIGVEACAQMPAMMVCLADMPFVSTAHLRALAAACDPAATPIVCSVSREKRMPPAIFARSTYRKLAEASGNTGARSLLAGASAIEALGRELADIDQPADLPESASNRQPKRSPPAA